MATVIFYEKPGCGNNTKQKVWLAASGHTVLAKNLLTEKWTAERLRAFFGDLPVAKWFNPVAPKIKLGEVDPAAFDAVSALDMMLAEPLLIRRPLMEVEGVLRAGFDAKAVDAWIGLNDAQPKEEPCPSGQARLPHPNPLPEGEGATAALRADLNSCHRSEPCPVPEVVT
ncbi:MAG: hypothetical protein EPO42_02450 [Gallionellaceae bacterium]|nr:MAG: hypothetical protein EPO42_02450 [Gallionellaceae bacterium]